MGSKHVYYSICAFVLLFLAVVEDSNAASCTRISKTQATDEYGSYGVWGGAYDANNGPLNLPSTINITDENFQPNGTLLASSGVDFVQYGQKNGYDPEQVLFSCTADSAGQLYEIYATNGDDLWGGFTMMVLNMALIMLMQPTFKIWSFESPIMKLANILRRIGNIVR
ncbi:hypothetical protein [Vibrio furnissii]|uniref:hypothetical protein n=1 Tax=Vibrio furnissii TaxID=29494 RepID=UPI001EEC05A8|nr:hypothetical protein [Vibrio furnissii]